MAIKQVLAVIERASDGGYGIYCPDLEMAIHGLGDTEEAAKQDMKEMLEETIEYCNEQGQSIPEELNNGDIEFVYTYDVSGFFQAYPVLNVSELGRLVGINASLMRHYKAGSKYASHEQKKKIEMGIHSLATKLSAVTF